MNDESTNISFYSTQCAFLLFCRRNARGVQFGHELDSEFKGNIPIPSEYGPPNRNRRQPQTGGNNGNHQCPRIKPNVRNAKTRCPGGVCQVTCSVGFEFPNGAISVRFLCKGKKWVLESFEQNNKVECKPKSSCPSKPDTQQADADCKSNECTINCHEGNSFPDGTTSMKMICENEKWEAVDVSFPPHCEG